MINQLWSVERKENGQWKFFTSASTQAGAKSLAERGNQTMDGDWRIRKFIYAASKCGLCGGTGKYHVPTSRFMRVVKAKKRS